MAITPDANEPWYRQRLRQLAKSQRDIARALDIHPSAVTNIFAEKRKLSATEAVQLASVLEVSVETLFDRLGLSTPAENPTISCRYAVLASGEVVPASEPLVKIAAPPGFDDEIVDALVVQGDSMAPRYMQGDILFAKKARLDQLQELVGHEVVAQLKDGKRYLCVLRPGAGDARYNLVDYRADVIPDAELEAVWYIDLVRPRGHVTRP